MSKAQSFSSAGSYPYKLLAHAGRYIREGFGPTHIFIYPTNACNLNCEYCCCSDEDRMQEPMSFDTFKGIVDYTVPSAITFAGGGEPTLHPDIGRFVEYVAQKGHGIKMGIMTNGLRCHILPAEFWDKFTWVRISMDGNRAAIPILDHPRVSYQWIDQPNKHYSTLWQWKEEGKIASLSQHNDIHESLIYEAGARKCYMPMVRPVFTPDGAVYTCCRAHYAIKGNDRSLPDQLRIAENVHEYATNYKPFDGSVCDRCFYGDFNRLMARIDTAMGTEDMEFI